VSSAAASDAHEPIPPGGRQPVDPEVVLRERFGLTEFRPGQREVIDHLVRHGRAAAVFPTGGGKSLCYQLPALLFDGLTVVVSPLIALMKDQIDVLTRLGVPAARLDSSLTADEVRAVFDRVRGGELKLLYVAPERFANERFAARMARVRIALFAVDEAHCVSEWGHAFRPEYLRLAEQARRFGAERVVALTATATPAVLDDMCAAFDIPRTNAVVTGFARPNLELVPRAVSAADRERLLAEAVGARTGAGIVYVTLQRTAERVARLLADAGIPARAYHAGMETDARTAVQEWWMAARDGVVVATIAFGMGIDRADVRGIWHYNVPKSLESYSQEIGRAGRDGDPARVELFAALDDVAALENFAYGDTPEEPALRALVERVLAAGETFEANLRTLSTELDVRELVLKTALTYLDLDGVVEELTPRYAAFEFRPTGDVSDLAAAFGGERARFVADLVAAAKKGRLWYALDPAVAAAALGQPRERVVAALEYLGERGLVELRSADLRARYAVRQPAADPAALAADLAERFAARETREVARVQEVLALVTHAGCQTNRLAAHFGEEHPAPCGHCLFCATGAAQAFPPAPARRPVDRVVDAAALARLAEEHPQALGSPRQRARFLCGLTSPATSQARLGRHPLFGACAEHRFADVLRWLSP
jgi:ATP-dependent DNA helicase RecQ